MPYGYIMTQIPMSLMRIKNCSFPYEQNSLILLPVFNLHLAAVRICRPNTLKDHLQFINQWSIFSAFTIAVHEGKEKLTTKL